MKISLINASPKVKGSASGALLSDLKKNIDKEADIYEVTLHGVKIPDEVVNNMLQTDVWIFAYPLYVDGLPGHLLSCLVQLEKACEGGKRKISVYGIANCGFYEGVQTDLSLDILKNWCEKAGLIWSGGIGIGGGGGLAMMPSFENGKGPKGPIDKAFLIFAEKILKKETQENVYVSVAFPRFLYRMGAQIGWRKLIKANGQKAKDLGKKPEQI